MIFSRAIVLPKRLVSLSRTLKINNILRLSQFASGQNQCRLYTAIQPPESSPLAASLTMNSNKRKKMTAEEFHEYLYFNHFKTQLSDMPDLCNRIYSQLKDVEIEILLELFPEFKYSLKWYKDKEEELNAHIEFDLPNHFREEALEDERFAQISKDSEKYQALIEIFDSSKGSNFFHDKLMVKDGSYCYFDSDLLSAFVNKLKSFVELYNHPKLNQFVQETFDQDYWDNLEDLKADLPKYKEYQMKSV